MPSLWAGTAPRHPATSPDPLLHAQVDDPPPPPQLENDDILTVILLRLPPALFSMEFDEGCRILDCRHGLVLILYRTQLHVPHRVVG
jgi:hypothetical protein